MRLKILLLAILTLVTGRTNAQDIITTEQSVIMSVAADSLSTDTTISVTDTVVVLANDSIARTDIWTKYGDRTTKFRPKQLILPVALVAVGSFGVCNGWFHSVNESVRDGMTDLRGDHYFHADDYIQYLPVIANVGLGLAKVPCKHTFLERVAITATAYISLGILVNGIKYSVKEKRPDSNARNSFPSGHTATAFMGAELVRISYPLGVGIGAYAVATGVAFLRLYNGRHWLNDVIAGAGIGILSARIGYWLLPVNRKIFRLKPKSTTVVAAAPFYDPSDRAFGASLAIRL
ncbi:MAG: phosphatase PAP2 family protein [Pseudoflavonifractor sp.]|nr:phosphatase PAP2 family protein [Pseudoflavonifractor sp.]